MQKMSTEEISKHRAREMPQPSRVWQFIIFLVFLLVNILGRRLVESRFGSDATGWFFLALLLAMTVAIGWLETRWRKRMRRLVCMEHNVWCINCGYHIDNDLPHGKCPECGADFQIAHLRLHWMQIVRCKPGRDSGEK